MKKIDEAIEVFKLNTTDFPNSANAWDSLADGYQNKGDKESAIKYYEKSLELNPQNKNAAEQLKKLKP
jgi:tetratricopeptide (TPR) repeat protein